jgi:hypothetical protein
MSTLRNLALALASLAIFPSVSSAADTTSFKVNSYVPILFRDLSWRASGSGSISGNDATGQSINSMETSNNTNGSDQEALSFSSLTNYRRIMLDDFRQLGLGVDVRYDRSRGKSRSANGNLRYLQNQYHESGAHSLTLAFTPSWDIGRYLRDDYFLSFRGNARLGCSISPTSHAYGDMNSRQILDSNRLETSFNSHLESTTGTGKSGMIDFAVGPGWGRAYDGSYGATALYMIEELRKTGAVTREPGYNEMMQLSDTIYWFRNRHFIDSRINRIQALTAIVAYLVSIGAVRDLGPYGCFILQDVWDYYPRAGRSLEGFDDTNIYTSGLGIPRQFGHRIRALFGYQYEFNKYSRRNQYLDYHHDVVQPGYDGDNQTETQFTEESLTYNESWSSRSTPYVSLIAEYYLPFGFRWQLNGMIQGWYYLTPLQRESSSQTHYEHDSLTSHSDEYRNRTTDDYHFLMTGTCMYVVNSRTSASFFASYDYMQGRDASGRVYNGDQVDYSSAHWRAGWEFQLGAELQYRISFPLTLSATARYRDSRSESQVTSFFHSNRSETFSLGASAQYDIF